MLSLFNRYATPFITGLFIISLITGVALFLHVGPSGFHGMHEILSLLLILPFALHLWKNWRPFLTYFKRAPMVIALGLSLVLAAPFLMVSEPEGGDRAAIFGMMSTVTAATPAEAAPLFHTTPDVLITALSNGGIAVTADQSMAEAAKAAGKGDLELATLLMAAKAN